MADEGYTLTTPAQMELWDISRRKAALKLEMKGLHLSSGRSMYAFIKKTYGFRGDRQRVLDQLEALRLEKLAALEAAHRKVP